MRWGSLIPQHYFDSLPKGARHKVAALWESMGSRIEDLEWTQAPWPERPTGGISPSALGEVQPSVVLTIRWHADNKKDAHDDLRKIEDRLESTQYRDFRFDGKEEPVDAEHIDLADFSDGTFDEEGLASATLVVPYAYYKESSPKWWQRGNQPPIKHASNMTQDGPQFRLVEKWNRQGVRCMLVNRWVPTPAEWEDEGVIDYWTGYVYVGADFDVVAMPNKVGSGGVLIPTVTYPEDRAEDPDDAGWIGWDNNIETGRDGPEEPEMTKEEAIEATNLLAKAVREVWVKEDVDPAEVYG